MANLNIFSNKILQTYSFSPFQAVATTSPRTSLATVSFAPVQASNLNPSTSTHVPSSSKSTVESGQSAPSSVQTSSLPSTSTHALSSSTPTVESGSQFTAALVQTSSPPSKTSSSTHIVGCSQTSPSSVQSSSVVSSWTSHFLSQHPSAPSSPTVSTTVSPTSSLQGTGETSLLSFSHVSHVF